MELGVDSVEFDVRAWRGELVLAHTILDSRRRQSVRLADALSHLAAPRFADLGLIVDVKHPGCEPGVLEELRHRGLLGRSLLTSQVSGVLDSIRTLEPGARTGISVGGRIARLSQRWACWRTQVLAGLADHRWDALMAQHRLIDGSLRSEVTAREASLYAWTVNDRRMIGELRALGVDGIVTADPRLFA